MKRPRSGHSGLPNSHLLALGGLLVVCLLLRLWGIKQGLPYSYNIDEDTHFVPIAMGFFGHGLNPHYFLNPPGYTYLLYGLFRLWFGGGAAVRAAYAHDPATVFILARIVAGVLSTVAVWLTYLTGARLFGRLAGLLAAAIGGLAFLPVFYSHLALNDAPTLAPVALSLFGSAGVLRHGRTRDYALAGVGVGLAAAFKYTGGITLVCLLGAFAWQIAHVAAAAPALRAGCDAGPVPRCWLLFLVRPIPYAALDAGAFLSGISQQASLAGGGRPQHQAGAGSR